MDGERRSVERGTSALSERRVETWKEGEVEDEKGIEKHDRKNGRFGIAFP